MDNPIPKWRSKIEKKVQLLPRAFETQWWTWYRTFMKPLVTPPVPRKLGMVEHGYNPSTGEMEGRESEVQGDLKLQSVSEDSLVYIRPRLNNQTNLMTWMTLNFKVWKYSYWIFCAVHRTQGCRCWGPDSRLLYPSGFSGCRLHGHSYELLWRDSAGHWRSTVPIAAFSVSSVKALWSSLDLMVLLGTLLACDPCGGSVLSESLGASRVLL